jgi:hypothetical protein
MIKIMHAFTMIFITSFLFSCVQVEPGKQSAKENIAISSVRDSEKLFLQGSTFSIEQKHAKETSFTPEKMKEAYKLYQHTLLKNLESNGFVYKAGTTAVDFEVGFGLALSSDVSDESLSGKFGLTPGLAEQNDLNKASFIVFVRDPYSEKMIWRGAVQGFAHGQLSAAKRASRVQTIVNQVMTLYYQGK